MKSFSLLATVVFAAAGCISSGGSSLPQGTSAGLTPLVGPHASQVTLVIMENKDFERVVRNPTAPYFNNTLVPEGVLLRNSHAVGHPSEPNYLELFSGSNQGIHSDKCPVYFAATNVASELIAAGKTFAGYSESMPRDGFKGCGKGLYDRDHNAWVDFKNVPASDNLIYHGFPSKPASFVWITPNLCHDTHNCPVRIGDTWLSENLPPIIAWDKKHDGLLIVTWDEAAPDKSHKDHIPTVLVGPMIKAGIVDREDVDHFSVLHTIMQIFQLPCIANDCGAPLITGIWK